MAWCDYMIDHPSFMYKNTTPEVRSYCNKSPPQTPYQLFWASILLGDAAHSSRFEQVSIGHTNISTSYNPHPNFQHEWWTLKGMLNDEFFYWCYWRQKLYHDKEEYVVRVVSFLGKDAPQEEYFLTQNTGIPYVNSLTFPLSFSWKGIVLKNLRTDKPFMLPNSTACYQCSNGVGKKMVMYPSCFNESFRGSWQHVWTSSEYGSKEAQSFMMRSFKMIENQMKPVKDVKEVRIYLDLEDGSYMELVFHVVDHDSQGWFQSTSGNIMDQHQSIHRVSGKMRTDAKNIYLEMDDFQCNIKMDNEFTLPGLSQKTGFVSGWKKDQKCKGQGWVEMIHKPSHHTQPTQIPIPSLHYTKSDLIASYCLWCLPLLLTIILFVMVFALPTMINYWPNLSFHPSTLLDPIPY